MRTLLFALLLVPSIGFAQTSVLTATPSSGLVPLSITFTSTEADVGIGEVRPSFVDGTDTMIDFGDGSAHEWVHCTESQRTTKIVNWLHVTECKPVQVAHIYTKPGSYIARIIKEGGDVLCEGPCPTPLAVLGEVSVTASSESFASSTAFVAFDANLSFGAKGATVVALQQFLTTEGVLDAGNVTGYFGKLTLAAVKRFQIQNGISPASGYFGPLTRAKANAVSI